MLQHALGTVSLSLSVSRVRQLITGAGRAPLSAQHPIKLSHVAWQARTGMPLRRNSAAHRAHCMV